MIILQDRPMFSHKRKSEEKRVTKYFIQFEPHYKTFEPKKLKLRRLLHEKSEKTSKYVFS